MEYGEVLLVKFGILGFGIRKPSCTDKESTIQNLESGVYSVESRIQDCLESDLEAYQLTLLKNGFPTTSTTTDKW